MNILLATYSYYPYNYGGTEVYVAGLASFLQEEGHQVTIIAGMPPRAFTDFPVLFEDEQLKSVEYYYGSVKVIGVVVKETTTTEIYNKFREAWVSSWLTALHTVSETKWDILHIHANTAAIGMSLIKAVKLHSANVKVIASYHVPLTCVKGTLMFGYKIEACKVKPTLNICTACCISENQKLPIGLARGMVALLPVLPTEHLPTSVRLKFLVREFLSALNAFENEIDLWHVFSEQVKMILELNEIPQKKIFLLRHGVSPDFFAEPADITRRNDPGQVRIFLYAGRFNKAKGFYTLLNAWCSFPESKERILWIIGEDQSNDEEVKKRIQAVSQRKDIKWLGTTGQEEVAAIMKKAHCTIIPSEWVEIGPLVYHEAIAAGSDVIASDIGGCGELAQVYKGKSILFEAGNTKTLATGIIEFNYSGLTETPCSQAENYRNVLDSYSRVKNE